MRNATYATALTLMIGWLLWIGKPILLPVLAAVISVYILSTAAAGMQAVPVLGRLPAWGRRGLRRSYRQSVTRGNARFQTSANAEYARQPHHPKSGGAVFPSVVCYTHRFALRAARKTRTSYCGSMGGMGEIITDNESSG